MFKSVKYFFIYIILIMFCVSCNTLISGSGVPQTVTYDLNNFSGVRNNAFIDVYITQGDIYSVNLTADDNILDYITIENNQNILTLTTKTFYSFVNCNAKLEVTMPDLTSCNLSGSGNISFSDYTNTSLKLSLLGSGNFYSSNVKTDDLEISLDGSGDITCTNYSISNLSYNICGSGDTTIYSSSNYRTSVVNLGSGKIHMENCYTTGDVDVSITGSGDLYIWVDSASKLTGSLLASGCVYYKGTPASINISKLASGDIIPIN